jgi:uncharacterized coiled-coil protein SlyX
MLMKKLNINSTTSIPAVLITLLLACVGLSTSAQAVSPPPDGGYPVRNTAEGNNALLNLAGGIDNTAVGFSALYSNTMGNDNTATGSSALLANTMGNNNTATGSQALHANTMGNNNTATGYEALEGNTTGGGNTAIGVSALENNAMGGNNTAVGHNALYRSTGSNNIALGTAAGSYLTASNSNIDIGNPGVGGDMGKIRIGMQGMHTGTFIAGISNVAVTGSPVVVNSMGRLGVTMSSTRFKDDIKPMDKASEAILALKPVTFHYKKEVDPDGIPQFGLVAEQVENVNPVLVARDEQGKVYSVRYDAVNAMLLNEFLKAHRKIEDQQATITELKSTVAQQHKDFQATAAHQQKQIEALTTGLQKVSAQLEVSRPAPQTVLNNQ